eukprot:NODE_17287_length_951_cov_4.841019.p1 GENE.NODE_17287_length_951_cov_4.841019~~NODE_17287_length_951_cov_4.841019.p1  ORF type:complete len:233 (-),score=67.68 NODE_17287_length_951_cov_4.841019:251-874(-)
MEEISPRPVMTEFQKQLVRTTKKSPERFAAKLIERLEQHCLEEVAAFGRTNTEFKAKLPCNRRFNDAVGAHFAGKLKELNFECVEWWSGKEWKHMVGRYCVLHSAMYDKYYMHVRVKWLDTYEGLEDDPQQSAWADTQSTKLTEVTLAALVTQIKHAATLQEELVKTSNTALKAAEERAASSEARALCFEQACLRELRKRAEGIPCL